MCDSSDEQMLIESEKDRIIDFLTSNELVFFKSQQRNENDLNKTEKTQIALDIYEKSVPNFLVRFGKYLTEQQLEFFQSLTHSTSEEAQEIDILLKNLSKSLKEKAHNVAVKNRRYEALLQMQTEDAYFSEIEMMKRNPLLYQQLVGQYLTPEERKERDRVKPEELTSLVTILMEGIERKNAEETRQSQENVEDEAAQMDAEDDVSSESSGSPEPCSTRWGEFEESQKKISKKVEKVKIITLEERQILKEEFESTMYQSFLDGHDVDFNYDIVDNNDSYDNIVEIDHDEEDKYFDSEEPEEKVEDVVESSEDELDMFMNAINQHPAVATLSSQMKKL